eukprot:gene12935-14265_t
MLSFPHCKLRWHPSLLNGGDWESVVLILHHWSLVATPDRQERTQLKASSLKYPEANLLYFECNSTCKKECVDLHNKYRKNHLVPPVVLDDQLSRQAQQWADNGKTPGSSNWTRKGVGECWAWGSLYPTWKDVIKEWHDQEVHIDWNTKKSKDGNDVYCFSQIVWKRVKKIGCAKGMLKSVPFYVVQTDQPAKVVDALIGYEGDNINRPIEEDIHWYDNETMTGASPNAPNPYFKYERIKIENEGEKEDPDFTFTKAKENQ